MQHSSEQFSKKIIGDAVTGGELIEYCDEEEQTALQELKKRDDFDALRLKRLMALSDLTRKEHSPLKYIVDRIQALETLRDFDVLTIPETISVKNNFDFFDFPADHPARKDTDTYFVNKNRVLRTHTTSMWLYYLLDSESIKKLEERGWIGIAAFGKVYRKDEIDRKHFPVFHQIDGLYICERKRKRMELKDLQDVLVQIVKGVFGEDVEYRFLEDTFPYTEPSTQIEVRFGKDWLELLGAGIPRDTTLEKLGIDPNIYNGWAFGFGVERLAMPKNNINDIRVIWSDDPRITKQFTSIESQYEEVSKFPPVIRDISFIVSKKVVSNRFYEIVREIGGNLIEEVVKIDEYENDEKLGSENKSYTFRIIYRSFERTLTGEEVNELHRKVEGFIKKELDATVR